MLNEPGDGRDDPTRFVLSKVRTSRDFKREEKLKGKKFTLENCKKTFVGGRKRLMGVASSKRGDEPIHEEIMVFFLLAINTQGESTAARHCPGHEESPFLPERCPAEKQNVQFPASVHGGDHPDKNKNTLMEVSIHTLGNPCLFQISTEGSPILKSY